VNTTYSNQVFDKNKVKHGGEFTDIAFQVCQSEDLKYIAITRFPDDFYGGFDPELVLVDLEGNVLFNKLFNLQSIIPLFVFSKINIVISMKVDSVNGHRRYGYVGLDFRGNEIWNLAYDEYYLDPKSLLDNDGRILLKKITYIGEKKEFLETRKSEITNVGYLDVVTGVVTKE